MTIDPQWVTAAAASIGCISLILVVWQVKVNHDRDRRIKAIDILQDFGKAATRDAFRYAGFMFSLPSEDVQKIQKGYRICVERRLVEPWLPDVAEKSNEEKIELGVELALDIRITMVRVLNGLEIVALAYKHGVADKKILDECFYDLLVTKEFLRKCREFIQPFGGGWDILKELPVLMNMPKLRKAPA
jgi:hypothetical protein